jgi:hypothetical protein
MPSSVALCRERRAGQGTDTPAMLTFRVGTFSTGTAPAFGRALAPFDGSDLLTLRLLLRLQLGDVVFHAAPISGTFTSFARLARSP